MSKVYPYVLFVICSDPTVGNKVAAALDPGDGSETFSGEFAVALRQVDSTGPATRWGADSLLTTEVYAVVRQFIDEPDSYPPALLAGGLTPQDVDDARACLVVEAGPRATHEYGFISWLASNGYEVIPR